MTNINFAVKTNVSYKKMSKWSLDYLLNHEIEIKAIIIEILKKNKVIENPWIWLNDVTSRIFLLLEQINNNEDYGNSVSYLIDRKSHEKVKMKDFIDLVCRVYKVEPQKSFIKNEIALWLSQLKFD